MPSGATPCPHWTTLRAQVTAAVIGGLLPGEILAPLGALEGQMLASGRLGALEAACAEVMARCKDDGEAAEWREDYWPDYAIRVPGPGDRLATPQDLTQIRLAHLASDLRRSGDARLQTICTELIDMIGWQVDPGALSWADYQARLIHAREDDSHRPPSNNTLYHHIVTETYNGTPIAGGLELTMMPFGAGGSLQLSAHGRILATVVLEVSEEDIDLMAWSRLSDEAEVRGTLAIGPQAVPKPPS